MKKLLIGLSLIWLMYLNMGSSCEGCGPYTTKISIGVDLKNVDQDTLQNIMIRVTDLRTNEKREFFPPVKRYNDWTMFGAYSELSGMEVIEVYMQWNSNAYKDTIELREDFINYLSLENTNESICDGNEPEPVQVDSELFYKCHYSYQPGCE